MFYKNVVLVLTMYLYSFCAMASSGLYFVGAYYDGYNVLYTGLPILVYGCNDQARTPSPSSDPPRASYVHCARTLSQSMQKQCVTADVPT